tara:strand:- start:207 stop:539 length:333 start_codon:yes stop_codon:yes gene_type:complete
MITKLTLAILKNSGPAGKRVKKFLNESQDEVEDFVVNTLLKKDKRSINEIIKEDGEAGVNKIDKMLKPKPKPKSKSKPKSKPIEKKDGGMVNKKRSVKKTKRTKWESKWG